jgi:hypothetical protein
VTDKPEPVDVPKVKCEICLKEIPPSEAQTTCSISAASTATQEWAANAGDRETPPGARKRDG